MLTKLATRTTHALIAGAMALASTQAITLAETTAPPTSQPDDADSSKQEKLPPPLDPTTDEPGLQVGQQAPNATLTNAKGEKVQLKQLYDDGPVIVTFYRGGWCPFCNRALTDWRTRMDEVEQLGATFIAISPESREHLVETSEKIETDYVALSDTTAEAMRRFRVAFVVDDRTRSLYEDRLNLQLNDWNAIARWELPAPATFVIDGDGIIQWVFADWDYRKRANPGDVLSALRKVVSTPAEKPTSQPSK